MAPIPHYPIMLDAVMHTFNLSTGEVESGDQKFKVIFSYTVSLSPAWTS